MKHKMLARYRVIQPWVIWGLGASFFFAEYFARVEPSVLVHNLMSYYHVGAASIGYLSAFFYIPYIVMQIPVGSLIDRYGPHRLITAMAILCALGSFLFAHSSDIALANLARFLMGFSAAFAFVGALKLATIWFEPRKLGMLAGLTQGAGMLGAFFGVGLFASMVHALGWQYSVDIIGAVLLILAILIGFFVRDNRPSLLSYRATPEYNHVSVFDGLLIVFRNPQVWINGLFVALLYAPTGALAELWGPSFLHRNFHLSPENAAYAISTIFLGWAIGGPIVGRLSDRIKRRKPILYLSAALSLLFICMVLYIPNLTTTEIYIILFLYGMSNTGVAISYAVASELNPLPVSGLAVAFTNMASIALAGALQPLIGDLLVEMWSGTRIHGIPFYSALDYKHAMIALPICLALACITAIFIRETHCQRK